VLGNLFYSSEGKWVRLPAWARFFLDTGAATTTLAAGSRFVLCLAVPSRSYAAALTACGIVATRAALPVHQASPTKHFELICNLPVNTAVTLLDGDRKITGVFDGCTDYHGTRCARIMVQRRGGRSHLIREADALRVKIVPDGPVKLPERKQVGRHVSSATPFARHLLGSNLSRNFVRQPQLECVIAGQINALRREIVETKFAVSSNSKIYHAGSLQDILQVRKFLNVGDPYKSDICRMNRRTPAFARDGVNPPYAIFDGAGGFIRWRNQLRDSHWIVILDLTDARFKEAAEVLNQAYSTRADDSDLPHLPPAPAGVEVMSFYEQRR